MIYCKTLARFVSFGKKAQILGDAVLVFIGDGFGLPYCVLFDVVYAEIF